MFMTKTFRSTLDSFRIEAVLYLQTKEEAEAVVAQFPKSYGVKASTFATPRPEEFGFEATDHNGNERARNTVLGSVIIDAIVRPDGVNGGINESGIKRIKSFLKKAAELGYMVEYDDKYWNADEAEYNALIES
jgi:hypothetical protein